MEEQLVVLVDPWQDKYDRLLEANEKLQKLNQTLEDKLLKLAEKNHAETSGLSEQIQDLTQRLVDARLYIHQLADENDRYRNDINVVIQLLQCKPSNFISPKIETLPEDLQRKILGIKNGVGSGGTRKEKKIIKVQVPTFPPTDIMYAVDKGKGKKNGDKDIVSAAIMAKVLQERENERKENRRNNCHCRYRVALPTVEKGSQTLPSCTISYSEFEFCTSEQDDDDEEGVPGEEEDDVDSLVNHHHDHCNMMPPKPPPAQQPHHGSHLTSPGVSSQVRGGSSSLHSSQQFHQGPPTARRPNSWVMPGGGRPPGGAVPVRTTLTTTFDEIIKTTREEEARLPTPLFDDHHLRGGNGRGQVFGRSHHDNNLHHQQDQSLSSLTLSSSTNPEPYPTHLHHQQGLNHHLSHHHHPHNPHHGDHHSGSLFINNPHSSDTSGTGPLTTSNGNVSSSCRDTPPSLQRSSSSSLSSPSSGLPPLSIPTSASITTDLNDTVMSLSSTSNSSHVMSSACNTPSSCSNASTSGVVPGGGLSIFHEPLPTTSTATSGSSSSSTNGSSNNHNTFTRSQHHHHHLTTIPTSGQSSNSQSSGSTSSISSTSYSSSANHVNNVVTTLRKGARLSTSHISNVCSNGSVTTSTSVVTGDSSSAGGGSYGLTRSTSWTREKVESTGAWSGGNPPPSSSSQGGASGGLGLMTSLGNHWRSTVLVHNPPRSHSSYEPLSLVSVQGDGSGGQQTTFSATLSPKPSPSEETPPPITTAVDSHPNEYSLDCNSDSEQPLLHNHHLHHHDPPPQQHHHHSYTQPPPTYLFHAYHNPHSATGGAGNSSSAPPHSNGGFFGSNSAIITNIGHVSSSAGGSTGGGGYNGCNGPTISNSNQYYRAQKRTFWARSSSTTSTETEI